MTEIKTVNWFYYNPSVRYFGGHFKLEEEIEKEVDETKYFNRHQFLFYSFVVPIDSQSKTDFALSVVQCDDIGTV